MCLHTILLDAVRQDRMFAAISAAGAFRSTVNAVNPFVFADLGNAPAFSGTKVEIEPAEPTTT
jgi:hypothetical protein